MSIEQYLKELKQVKENDRKFMERITRKPFVPAQPITGATPYFEGDKTRWLK